MSTGGPVTTGQHEHTDAERRRPSRPALWWFTARMTVRALARRIARIHPDLALARVLLVLWALWLGVVLLVTPRMVSGTQLQDDVRAGRVLAWHAAEARAEHSGWVLRPSVSLRAAPAAGAQGTADDGGDGADALVYWVDEPLAQVRVAEGADVGTLVAIAREGGAPEATGELVGLRLTQRTQLEGGLALALGVVGFGLVVLGRAPRRGTRWYWFFLLGLPLGLGLVAYLVREWLRPPAVGAAPPRSTGPTGVVVLIGVGLLTGVALTGLASVVGPALALL